MCRDKQCTQAFEDTSFSHIFQTYVKWKTNLQVGDVWFWNASQCQFKSSLYNNYCGVGGSQKQIY